MSKITLALIVEKPGHLWNGLWSLLRTIPQIKIITETLDPSALMNDGNEMPADLILLDANLFDEDAWMAVTDMRREWPQTHFIVLTESDAQRKNAQKSGAELVLPKGYPAAKLITLIEDLIAKRDYVSRIEHNSKHENQSISDGGANDC